MNGDLAVLSPGERLRLWRWRRGWSQRRAAEFFGVHRHTLLAAENDRSVLSAPGAKRAYGAEPTLPLALRIARKRWGVDGRTLARKAGVSHVTFLAAEAAGRGWLVEFWQDRGFRHFPALQRSKGGGRIVAGGPPQA